MYLLLTIPVLLILSFVFSINARQNILAALTATNCVIQGTWRRLWYYAGRSGRVLAFLFLINLLLLMVLGIKGDAPVAGFVLGLIIPVWFLFFILRPLSLIPGVGTGFGSIIRPIWIGLNFIVVPCAIFLAIGLWSPVVKRDFDRWAGNMKGELANLFSKSSVQSEPEAGIVGFANEDEVVVYNVKDRRTPIKRLKSGETVMIVNLKGKPVDEDTEGMVPVKLANEFGDFNGKLNGWVVSRKVSWSKPRKAETSPPPPPPTPEQAIANSHSPMQVAALPGESAPLPASASFPAEDEWEMRRTHTTKDGREVSYTNINTLSLSADNKKLTMREKWRKGTFVYEGALVGEREYEGRFYALPNLHWGTFRFKLSPDYQSGDGWRITTRHFERLGETQREEVILQRVK